MANISKPSKLNLLWASGGDILDPGDTKYQTGWTVEVPPRQWENYIQNKQDQAIAHINQHGIAVWDDETEYQAGKSYVQGSDGLIYQALSTNTNVDPVGDISGTWEQPFVKPSDIPETPTATNTHIIFPGGYVIQWVSGTGTVPTTTGSTADVTVTYPVPLSTVLSVHLTQGAESTAESAELSYSVHVQTNTGATARFRRVSGTQTGSELIRANFLIVGIAA